MRWIVWRLLVGLLALGGCSGEMGGGADDGGADAGVTEDAGLPSGYSEWARICSKHYGDAVSARLCGDQLPPRLGSLMELLRLVGLDDRSKTGLVMTGLSTGVGLRMVTPLNPRAILMSDPLEPRYTVLAFARGEPLVELVANDPAAQTLRFFAVRFHPACEAAALGCNAADLLTPAIESGWTGYTLYDDEALANTTLDCLACHQPRGPGTPKMLRMQEVLAPWTHWVNEVPTGAFLQTHGAESYAGFPSGERMSSPMLLQRLLQAKGFGDQPNAFASQTILDEIAATGTSATWQALYDNAVAGRELPPPYYDVDQTDPERRASWVSAYQQVMAGTLARDLLPDVRSILLDAALPAMSIRPKAGLDGRGILVHMCSQCHNSRLDQTVSRARFNVMALDAMSREEKDLAIARLQLAEDHPARMPPPRFRSLSATEQALAIEELSR